MSNFKAHTFIHYILLLDIHQIIQNSITEKFSHQSLLLANTRTFGFYSNLLLFRENFILITFGILIRPRRDALVCLLLSFPWEVQQNDWLRPCHIWRLQQLTVRCLLCKDQLRCVLNCKPRNKGQMEEFGHSGWRYYDSFCDYITSH